MGWLGLGSLTLPTKMGWVGLALGGWPWVGWVWVGVGWLGLGCGLGEGVIESECIMNSRSGSSGDPCEGVGVTPPPLHTTRINFFTI